MGLFSGAGIAVQFPRQVLAAIFPDDCRLCGDSLRSISPYPVCDSCVSRVVPIEAEYLCERCGTPFLHAMALDENGHCRLCRSKRRGFDACYTYGDYDGELRQLIHLFKYGKVESLARPLAGWMLRALPRHKTFECIVPVPMFWWKRLQRGFNQAESLAREISRATAVPVVHALRRPHASGVQAGMAVAARRKNAAQSFAIAAVDAVAGKSVLLVDDVFTTGATATACGRLLKRAGAAEVAILTVARVDRRAPAPLYPAGHPDTTGNWSS